MYDARFRGLDEALAKIGGQPMNDGWRWTSEADHDPECNSSIAFIYGGLTGSVGNSSKYGTYSVRPVAAFRNDRDE